MQCSVQRPALSAQRRASAVPRRSPLPCTRPASACSALQEPARPVALPSGALWLLDSMQDQFYTVRGEAFVIARTESNESGESIYKRKFQRWKQWLAVRMPQPQSSSHGLIHQALWEQPTALMLVSDEPLIDVEAEEAFFTDPTGAADEAPAWAPGQAAVTSTGIVRVPSTDEAEDVEGLEASEYVQTTSNSPRRTKLLRFTCLANGCQTVNVKPINPIAFKQGTAFAQCGKCGKWHRIVDHLNLWDQMQGPLPFAMRHPRHQDLQGEGPVPMEELPESLRISPEDLDWLSGGGRIGGFKRDKA